MKSNKLRWNKFYWSTRLNKIGACKAYTGYMAYMIFVDNTDNGWYHCIELEEVNRDKRKVA